MSLPQPSVALTGSCSVIFEDTLYSYSGAGFQSLVLEQGGEWESLPDGESVDGAVCVGATPLDSATAGLFVVGGTSSSADYPGLQKFTFSTGKWETITPQVLVTKDRVYHSATYINSTDSILVYSGSTDGTPNLSQQTFTVGASEPHAVTAYQSDIVAPGVAPFLMPWSETQAVMIGGNPTNTKVTLFDPTASPPSWTDSGITLAEPLPKNSTLVKATIVKGDDNSKHLYTFDLTHSPNTVNRTVLVDGSGSPVTNAAPISHVSSRDLNANDWPEYNSTLVPDSIRTDYSMATDSDGMVVMSGGNKDDVLCIFNAKKNSWQNATALLVSDEVFSALSLPSASSSSTTTSAEPSATSAAETSAAATPTSDADSSLKPTVILGIVLGIVFGIAVVLIALLLLIRRQRKKHNFAEAGHARRASGTPAEKEFFPQEPAHDAAPASGDYFRGHNQQESAGSFSSMAILMGRVQKPATQRKASNGTQRSSVSSILNKQFKSTIGRPQPQSNPEPEFFPRDEKVSFAANTAEPKPRAGPPLNPDGSTRRSSGWNRYWSGGSALNILGFGNNGNNSRRETAASDESSQYSTMNRMTQDSATVPPLQVEGRPEFSRVNSGNPAVSQYNPRIGEGMSGQIERPVSAATSSGYSSGIPPSVHDNWDPTVVKKPWGTDRAPSSAYSQSHVGVPSSIYPTTSGPPGTSGPPTGISRQPQLHVASISTDMSWLNLGDNNPTGNGRAYH